MIVGAKRRPRQTPFLTKPSIILDAPCETSHYHPSIRHRLRTQLMFTCQASNTFRSALFVVWIVAGSIVGTPSTADDQAKKPAKPPRKPKAEAVATKEKDAKDTKADDAKSAEALSYKPQDAPVLYRFALTNRIGKEFTRKVEGNLTYSFRPSQPLAQVERNNASLMVAYRGNFEFSMPRVDQTELPLFQLGNFSDYRNDVIGFVEMMPSGKVVRSDTQGRGVDGLPWDYATYAFPELPAAGVREWTKQQEYTVLRTSKSHMMLTVYNGQQWLRPATVFGLGAGPNVATVAVQTGTLTLAYKQSKQSDSETVFEESIEFDGSNFTPTVVLSGSGVIRFDNKEGLVRSIERKMTVKFKDEANETSYPIDIKLTRLEGKALEAHQKEEKERADQAKQRMAEYKAKMDQVPSQEDREAVIKVIESGDDSAIETLITKFRSDQALKEDAELGKLLYKRLGKMRNVPYSASDVFKTLAPDLFQSASIARDYNSSFDIGLTGKELKKDTKLAKGQIVCYPYYSRWQAGEFYAAAEDVVVLYTKGHERKLVVFLRSECRLPAPQFIDPTSLDDETHAEESPED